MRNDLDLGHDHFLRFFRWAPDDLAVNRERYGTPLPSVEKAGAILRHQRPDGDWCEAAIHFDIPERILMGETGNCWTVEGWEPLTLAPSFVCGQCGDHGFIRAGRWVKA